MQRKPRRDQPRLRDRGHQQPLGQGSVPENLSIIPANGIDGDVDIWATARGTHLRRVHVQGDLDLDDKGGWASGGFIADSLIDGRVTSGSQQQYLTRNDQDARAAEEGCLGETAAALRAAEELDRTIDPAVCSALAVIAEDEARHAELAWRAVTWAVRSGGAEVRAAVAAVLARAGRREVALARVVGPAIRALTSSAQAQR